MRQCANLPSADKAYARRTDPAINLSAVQKQARAREVEKMHFHQDILSMRYADIPPSHLRHQFAVQGTFNHYSDFGRYDFDAFQVFMYLKTSTDSSWHVDGLLNIRAVTTPSQGTAIIMVIIL